MKKYLFAFIYLISVQLAFSQDYNSDIFNEKITVGYNSISKKEINGVKFHFPHSIYNFHFDSLARLLTLDFRDVNSTSSKLSKNGQIAVFDLVTDKVKWLKKLKLGGSFDLFGHLITQSIGNECLVLDAETGQRKWELHYSIAFIDPKSNIAIGYDFGNISNKIYGVNLKNGNTLWTRKLSKDYSLNTIFLLNDSVVMVVTSGLHFINLKTGKGWDYKARTSRTDYSELVAINAAGVALGLLTGVYVISTGYNSIDNLNSNVLQDNSCMYFASSEKLTSLDYSGNVLWNTSLPKDWGSNSTLFIKDSVIYLINKGYAIKNEKSIEYGTPFIAAFNCKNGNQIYSNKTNWNKPILDYKIKNDTISILYYEKIEKYLLSKGTLIGEKNMGVNFYDGLLYYVDQQVYVKKIDSTYCQLTLPETTKSYIYTNNGSVLILNNDLNIESKLFHNNYYVLVLKSNKYKFLRNRNQIIIVDESFHQVATLNVSDKIFLIGNILYDMQEKSFTKIDLSEIL